MKFKSISDRYSSAFDMLSDYAPEFISGLDKDAADYLAGIGDYESFAYTVVNDQIVIVSDSINFDVYETTTLPEFIKQTAAYLVENVDDYRD